MRVIWFGLTIACTMAFLIFGIVGAIQEDGRSLSAAVVFIMLAGLFGVCALLSVEA